MLQEFKRNQECYAIKFSSNKKTALKELEYLNGSDAAHATTPRGRKDELKLQTELSKAQ